MRIPGPTFSSSWPSLQYALQRNLAPGSKSPKETEAPLCAYVNQRQIAVSSGSVSSGYIYSGFSSWIGDQKIGSFITTAEDDALSRVRFCGYLRVRHYNLERIVVLSENETAFVALTSSSDTYGCPAIRLYYPRDIATVRSAYGQRSIFTPSKSSCEAPATRLRGDLSEPPGRDKDTVRPTAGRSLPYSRSRSSRT
jgi:hypothetical protein